MQEQLSHHELCHHEQEIELGLIKNGYDRLIAKVLSSRCEQDVNNLFQKRMLHYSLLDSIKEATELLKSSLLAKKNICIVADYDADGATSCAIAYRALSSMGFNVFFYVPNRFIDGYGLSRVY